MKNEKKTLINQSRGVGGPKQSGGSIIQGNTALTEFIRNMDDTVLNSTWHVLSVQPTSYDPGMLKLWAMTEQGQMFQIKMQVGRKLYINSKVIEGDASFKKVEKELPRGRKSFNLYEYEVTEEFYRQKHSNIKFEHLLSK